MKNKLPKKLVQRWDYNSIESNFDRANIILQNLNNKHHTSKNWKREMEIRLGVAKMILCHLLEIWKYRHISKT